MVYREVFDMYKVRKIKFIDHPILKNMELDFVGMDGEAVDTVISTCGLMRTHTSYVLTPDSTRFKGTRCCLE